MRYLRLLLVACLLLAPVGCHHLGQLPGLVGYQKVADAQAQVAAAQRDGDAKLAALHVQTEAHKVALVATKQAQAQEASNHLFGSQMAFTIEVAPTATQQIMHEEDTSAALTLPAPDASTVATKMDVVRKLLLDKQHLIDNLTTAAAQAKVKADQLALDEGKEKTQIANLTKQKDDVVKETSAAITVANGKLKTATDKALARANELLSNKAEINAIKTKLVIAAAALGALLVIAAIFSPLFKLQLGEAAGVFLAAAAGILYIQPWMVAVGLGLGLLFIFWHVTSTHAKVVSQLPDPTPTPPTPAKP